MSAVDEVFVLAEKPQVLAELCAGGHQFGKKVSAVIIGPRDEAENALCLGADHVYWLSQPGPSVMMEDYVSTLADLTAAKKPGLFLISSTKRCKLMAGRLAARLGTAVMSDVLELTAAGDHLEAKRMVYGGAAVRTEKSATDLTIATVGAGLFAAASSSHDSQGVIEEIPFIAPAQKITRIEKRDKGEVSVNLAVAKRVIAVGRGLASQEDLKMIEELAGLIGAEVGCTRPLTESVNWLPRERYIGVSGVMFKPELYIGIGISGQVQHMVGINQARTIIAINSDKAAPIFNQTDYGIAGDLYKVVPALINKIKAGK